MALNIFHFVQERIEDSREKFITDKKKIPIWSKRMHLGLKAYKVGTRHKKIIPDFMMWVVSQA